MITAFWILVILIGWLVISVLGWIAFKKLIPQHIQRRIERLHEDE